MKHTKKLFAIALTLIMALALTVPAFAAEDPAEKTIKVENSIEGETYKAYKVFDLTKTADADKTGSGYAYTIEEGAMFDLVLGYMEAQKADDAKLYEGKGLKLTLSTESGKWNVTHSGFNAVAFAEYLNGAKKDGIVVADEATATGKGVELKVAGAGYYFVDSSLGALCALDTADTVTVYEKNSIPTITKWVDEDDDKDANEILGNSEWQKTADADYGQTVNYLLIVNTGTNHKNGEQTSAGADEVYEIVDTIPADLCFNDDIVIECNGEAIDTAKYTVNSAVNENNETVVTIILDAKGAAEDTNFNIYYSVKVGPIAAGEAHTNTAVLTYQEQTSSDSATLYTWEIPVFKYTGDDVALANAIFEIKNEAGEVLKFDAVDGKPNSYIYNKNGAVEKITTDETGLFTIIGLDSATYTLTETTAPAGYNALLAPITMKIEAEETVDGEYTGEYQIFVKDEAVEKPEFVEVELVKVLNMTGTELPSTGGIGTTIFYVIGGLLMAGAGILLVTKKRMADEE